MILKKLASNPLDACLIIAINAVASCAVSGFLVVFIYGFWLLSGFVCTGEWHFFPENFASRSWGGLGLIMYFLFFKPIAIDIMEIREAENT